MTDSDKERTPYDVLGLPPEATLDQVKSRYRELNDAYLKILQSSRGAAKPGAPSGPASADDKTPQPRLKQGASQKESSHPQETRTEPIARIKARFAKGEIQKAQFEKLAKE